jgi:hypothetical protein
VTARGPACSYTGSWKVGLGDAVQEYLTDSTCIYPTAMKKTEHVGGDGCNFLDNIHVQRRVCLDLLSLLLAPVSRCSAIMTLTWVVDAVKEMP